MFFKRVNTRTHMFKRKIRDPFPYGQRETTRKTYFLTDTEENTFPQDFINSTNKRYIEVQDCHYAFDGSTNLPEDIIMHASFIKQDPYLDHAVFKCNMPRGLRTKYKKYEYKSSDEKFTLWFTNFGPSSIVTEWVLAKEPYYNRINAEPWYILQNTSVLRDIISPLYDTIRKRHSKESMSDKDLKIYQVYFDTINKDYNEIVSAQGDNFDTYLNIMNFCDEFFDKKFVGSVSKYDLFMMREVIGRLWTVCKLTKFEEVAELMDMILHPLFLDVIVSGVETCFNGRVEQSSYAQDKDQTVYMDSYGVTCLLVYGE